MTAETGLYHNNPASLRMPGGVAATSALNANRRQNPLRRRNRIIAGRIGAIHSIEPLALRRRRRPGEVQLVLEKLGARLGAIRDARSVSLSAALASAHRLGTGSMMKNSIARLAPMGGPIDAGSSLRITTSGRMSVTRQAHAAAEVDTMTAKRAECRPSTALLLASIDPVPTHAGNANHEVKARIEPR
jgi:hypothetical protein